MRTGTINLYKNESIKFYNKDNIIIGHVSLQYDYSMELQIDWKTEDHPYYTISAIFPVNFLIFCDYFKLYRKDGTEKTPEDL